MDAPARARLALPRPSSFAIDAIPIALRGEVEKPLLVVLMCETSGVGMVAVVLLGWLSLGVLVVIALNLAKLMVRRAADRGRSQFESIWPAPCAADCRAFASPADRSASLVAARSTMRIDPLGRRIG